MAVAYDASSVSHVTQGSISETSFTWSHNPVAAPKGVVVFVIQMNSANSGQVSGVTYDGEALTHITGLDVTDAAGEPGRVETWFLGTGINTTDPANIVVSRSSSTIEMMAFAATVTAGADTEIYEAGASLVSGDGTLTQVQVDDGSPGAASVRFAAAFSGLSAAPGAGGNSTQIQSFDTGNQTASFVRETTAGQGNRFIGFASGTSDDRAVVHLAVREAAALVDADAEVAWTELEVPTASSQAQVAWTELEVPTASSQAQVAWAALEVPNVDSRADISWTELEVPFLDARADVAWAELEVPTADARADIAWAEFEVPTADARADIAWTEVEIPDLVTDARADISWLEMEFPTADARADIAWAELEVPFARAAAQIAWTEVQVPFAIGRADLSFTEFEVVNANSRADVAWAELEVPTASSQAEVAHAQFEVPTVGGTPENETDSWERNPTHH